MPSHPTKFPPVVSVSREKMMPSFPKRSVHNLYSNWLFENVSLTSRSAMKESPRVAEIVFLLGGQWLSRCRDVGMLELSAKAIILPCVAQWGRESSKKKAGSCSSLGIASSCDERPQNTPGHTQLVLALAGATGPGCYAEAVPKGGGTRAVTFGLSRVWRLNKRICLGNLFPLHFCKTKVNIKGCHCFPSARQSLSRRHFYSNQ